MMSPVVFFIFSKFWFFVLLVEGGGVEGQGGGDVSVKNGPKWQKTVHHTSYLKNHTLYDCHLWVVMGKKGEKWS